jgi:hypothetical protein
LSARRCRSFKATVIQGVRDTAFSSFGPAALPAAARRSLIVTTLSAANATMHRAIPTKPNHGGLPVAEWCSLGDDALAATPAKTADAEIRIAKATAA